MKIRPVTVRRCIVYPAIMTTGAAAGLHHYCMVQQPGQILGDATIIEDGSLSADDKMRLAEEALRRARELTKLEYELCRGEDQVPSGIVCRPKGVMEHLQDMKRQRVREAIGPKIEELLKQAEKWEREALEESGAVTSPTDSKTDTESQAADSKPHS